MLAIKKIFFILPTQLFQDIKILKQYDCIVLIKDTHYINNKFHKQKILLHLSSLDYYYDYLKKSFKNVFLYDCKTVLRNKSLYDHDITMYDVIDKDIYSKYSKFKITFIDTPLFINSREINNKFLVENKKIVNNRITFSCSIFYKFQRERLKLFMSNGKPLYDNWNWDKENRNKFTSTYKEPKLKIYNNKYIKKHSQTILNLYSSNFGECNNMYYPTTHLEAKNNLKSFLKSKIIKFGYYQDAISKDVIFGNHSNLSSSLNIGLITPEYVVKETMKAFNKIKNKKDAIIEFEAFIRQIIGWREYMRMIYSNFYDEISMISYIPHNNTINKNWYTGNTKLDILDNIINKVYKYAYIHHIERLMIINNIAMLLEIKIDEIKKWFMITGIDTYDWVMDTNILMNLNFLSPKIAFMKKTYLCSDNYLKKMSDYKDMKIINKLYWNYLKKYKNELKKDYILASLISKHI